LFQQLAFEVVCDLARAQGDGRREYEQQPEEGMTFRSHGFPLFSQQGSKFVSDCVSTASDVSATATINSLTLLESRVNAERIMLKFECGTRIFRVIQGRDA